MADINSIFIPKRISALLRNIYRDMRPGRLREIHAAEGIHQPHTSGRHVCPLHNRCG